MKAAFHTLGCKVNIYETTAIREQFEALGFETVPFTEKADVYVINTCSVTNMAEHKSRQMIHRARKKNPEAVIAACGCYCQRAPKELEEDSNADIIFGNNRKSEIAEEVLDLLKNRNKEQAVHVDDLKFCRSFEPQRITSAGENVRAYVKIQDGCDRFCSYCIIPYVRGRSRSRNKEDILAEVNGLAAGGYKEIVLTGIDISTFDNLAELIEAIDLIPGVARIRLGSLEESVITPEFISRVSKCKSFCPHFHLSLQSGSESVLKRMNRHYSPETYLEKVKLIRENFEICGITTDIITGFAGETEEEHRESLEFIKKAAFTQAHVFKYSRRKGTLADKMPAQVSEAKKNARSAEMIDAAGTLQHSFMESLIGRERPLLVEETVTLDDGRKAALGFTPEYVRIAYITDENMINSIINVVPNEIALLQGEPVLLAEGEHLY